MAKPSNTKSSNDTLQTLEKQVAHLAKMVADLKVNTNVLQHRQSYIEDDRKILYDRNHEARTHIASLIAKLKTLE